MVHLKLLLVTGVTCLGLVPWVPSAVAVVKDAGLFTPENLTVPGTAPAKSVSKTAPPKPTAQSTQQAITRKQLAQPASDASTTKPAVQPAAEATAPASPRRIAAWIAIGLLPVGIGVALYCERSNGRKPVPIAAEPEPPSHRLDEVSQRLSAPPQPTPTGAQSVVDDASVEPTVVDVQVSALASSEVAPTTRLSRVEIVEAMISDLHSSDAAKRRKAIWELGQQGDSRAVQPLVDLLVDSDSQQRSLILAALAEISIRALKPVNRALLLSLQDESTDVRKNAIRDITRIYDLMTQASQLLQYAASDQDEEVQETAHWALGQLNRLRSMPEVSSSNTSSPERRSLNGREPLNGSAEL